MKLVQEIWHLSYQERLKAKLFVWNHWFTEGSEAMQSRPTSTYTRFTEKVMRLSFSRNVPLFTTREATSWEHSAEQSYVNTFFGEIKVVNVWGCPHSSDSHCFKNRFDRHNNSLRYEVETEDMYKIIWNFELHENSEWLVERFWCLLVLITKEEV